MQNDRNLIKLKSNWDQPIKWFSANNMSLEDNVVYVNSLKRSEAVKIKDFVQRKGFGSLIVSGQRGSGKTSTIISVIKSIEKGSEETFIPIYLNCLFLESTLPDPTNPSKQSENILLFDMLHVLKQLIRQWIFELEMRKIRINNDIRNLYNDVKATQIKLRRSYEKKIGLSTSIDLENFISSQSSSAKGNIFYSNNGFRKKEYEFDELSIENIVEQLSLILSKFEKTNDFHFVKKSFFNGRIEIQIPFWPKKCEIKLRSSWDFIFRWLVWGKNKNRRLLFIIDELDVYNESNNDQILKFIKKLKNLFTLSDAHFIFIVGRDTFKKTYSLDQQFDNYRTLFSDKVFLSQPNIDELSSIIDNLVCEDIEKKFNEGNLDKKTWEQFKWYLIFKSGSNFYNLIQELKKFTAPMNNEIYLDCDFKWFSEREKKLANLFYLTSYYYKYFYKEPRFILDSEMLYKSLFEMVGLYGDYLYGTNITAVVTLKVPLEDIDVETTFHCMEKRKGLIKVLMTIIKDQRVNEPLVDPIQNFRWNEISESLTYDLVKRGIKGPVLDAEVNLLKQARAIIDLDLSKILFSRSPISDFEVTTDIVETLYGFKERKLFLASVEEVENAISELEKYIHDKDIIIIEKGVNNLIAIQTKIESDVPIVRKSFYLHKFFGSFEKSKDDNTEIVTTADNNPKFLHLGSAINLVPTKKTDELRRFSLEFETVLESESILDVLLFSHVDESSDIGPMLTKSEFYMARLDSRPSEGCFNGFLIKKRNEATWGFVGERDDDFNADSGKWVQCKITFFKQKLSFYIKKNGKGYKKIQTLAITDSIKQISFSNELKSIKLAKILFK